MNITFRKLDSSTRRRHVVVVDGVDQEAYEHFDDAEAHARQIVEGYCRPIMTRGNMTAEGFKNASRGNR